MLLILNSQEDSSHKKLRLCLFETMIPNPSKTVCKTAGSYVRMREIMQQNIYPEGKMKTKENLDNLDNQLRY